MLPYRLYIAYILKYGYECRVKICEVLLKQSERGMTEDDTCKKDRVYVHILWKEVTQDVHARQTHARSLP